MDQNQSVTALKALDNHVFAATAGKEIKSMMLGSDAILLCSKEFKDPEEFKTKFEEVFG